MINQASNVFLIMDGKKPVALSMSLRTDKWRVVTIDLLTGHMVVDGMRTEIVYSDGNHAVPVQQYGKKRSAWYIFKAKWRRKFSRLKK